MVAGQAGSRLTVPLMAVWPWGGQPLGLGFPAREKEPKEGPALGCGEDAVGAVGREPLGQDPA